MLADFEHGHRIGQALEAVAAVRAPERGRGTIAELLLRAVCELIRNSGQKDLARQRELHQARGGRLDQAFDFERLGAFGNIFGRVVPCDDVADMDADARAQLRRARRVVERAQAALVRERECDRLDRAIEHHHEAVGLVDLAAAVLVRERAREAIVPAEKLRSAQVA